MTNKKRFWVSWWQSGVLTYGWKISDKVVANGDKFISVGAVIDLDTFEDDDDVLEAMVWELVSKTIPSFNKNCQLQQLLIPPPKNTLRDFLKTI